MRYKIRECQLNNYGRATDDTLETRRLRTLSRVLHLLETQHHQVTRNRHSIFILSYNWVILVTLKVARTAPTMLEIKRRHEGIAAAWLISGHNLKGSDTFARKCQARAIQPTGDTFVRATSVIWLQLISST